MNPQTRQEYNSQWAKENRTPEYRSWLMMRNRCNNPNAEDYKYYGGRGITVCPQWDSFQIFLSDLGHRPKPNFTLERHNNNQNYTPENCYWATRKTQARNRNCNKLTLKEAEEIRRLYSTGNYLQRELAVMYGVNQTLISAIIRGTAWVNNHT